MSFLAASYNVLATAYVERAWYPRTPALLLNPAARVPALVQHIARLNADLLCLQEVEPPALAALRATLIGRGYDFQYARKRNNRPDGCAIFYRHSSFELVESQTIVFADGGGRADSGYVALAATFRFEDRLLQVISTHLSWDPPGVNSVEQQLGYRQVRQLLAEQAATAPRADGLILAGDFNVTPDSALVQSIEQSGLQRAHRGLDRAYTCNVNRDARVIDYIFHSGSLRAEALAPMSIDDHTTLPNADQPSDHIAILARFHWQS
ncbi:MAG: hypothetical protein FJ145_06575 [Deltaproteobacteria bacterium]|nr:hypothetical protein [Deltaproteobacteria bacterium]